MKKITKEIPLGLTRRKFLERVATFGGAGGQPIQHW